VNGIMGGYTGAGGKTVIPSWALAKLTFRLAAGQSPAAVKKAFRKFVKDRVPSDCKVRFLDAGGEAPACVVSEQSRFVQRAARALKNEWGREPVYMGAGGTIPIVSAFKSVLGMDSLLAGFGLDDDAPHSPNEKYSVPSFHRGIRSWIRIFEAVARK
jgi:acetylornithine deacetylase/succinyl-diaminopimelate desuccinylase-like protein